MMLDTLSGEQEEVVKLMLPAHLVQRKTTRTK